MRLLDRYLAAIDRLNQAVKCLLVVLTALMSAVVIAQVFCRLTRIQLPWTEELARYLMIYATFIGTGYAVRHDLMMSVAFVRDRLRPGQRRLLSVIANLIVLAFFALIFLHGLGMLARVHMQRSPALQCPMSVPYSATVTGSALMMVNAVAVILERLFKAA